MAETTTPFMQALKQLAVEKNLPEETVLEAVSSAIAAAYRKDYGKPTQVYRAKLEGDLQHVKIFQVFTVVKTDELEDPEHQMLAKDAKQHLKKAKAGDEVEIEKEYHPDFGRIAAQTAKQVIIQRLREAERELLYTEFKEKEHQVLTASVQQMEGDNVIVNLGKVTAVMLPHDQLPNERYYTGKRVKVFVYQVEETSRGPQILVSRSSSGLIYGLFASEVPEISSGAVEIKMVAREAGSRSKVAVISHQEGLDPVGSCVGQRGSRVQAVLSEIGEEKIDIVLYDDDIKKFIENGLSPARIDEIKIDTKEKRATVKVPNDQLSLAIGRNGQNVRLASKLAGWNIDIVKDVPIDGRRKTEDGEPKKDKDTSNKISDTREPETGASDDQSVPASFDSSSTKKG